MTPGEQESRPGRAAFDLSVFEQDRVWVDPQGYAHPVRDLSWRDRRRLARWLRANARHFYAQVLLGELLRTVHWGLAAELGPGGGVRVEGSGGDALDGHSRAPSATGGGAAGAERMGPFDLPEVVFIGANEWMEGTPLMRALSRRRRR